MVHSAARPARATLLTAVIVAASAACLAAVAGVSPGIAQAAAPTSRRPPAPQVTVVPDTVTRLPAPPASTGVPADGRLRGDGFALTVDGVATGPATATQRAGPGQRLWEVGITAVASPPATGGAANPPTVTLVAATTTVPVPVPADGTTSWWLASLPAAGDVTLAATPTGTGQTDPPAVFSLTRMSREGASPVADYRDPTGAETTGRPGPPVDVPVTFTLPQEDPPEVITDNPLHVAVDTVRLDYRAPDTTGHVAAGPAGAWLWVTLSSDPTNGHAADSLSTPTLLAATQPLPATAITLTVPGQPPVPAIDVAGGGGDTGPGGTNPDPTDAFPDTYLFPVPATLTTATLTVTPGPFPARSNEGDPTQTGTATPTPAGAHAAITLTLPTPTSPTPPPGAATRPAALTATTGQASGPGRSAGGLSAGTVTGIVIAGILILAAAVAVTRRRPRPAAATASGAATTAPDTPPPAPADPWEQTVSPPHPGPGGPVPPPPVHPAPAAGGPGPPLAAPPPPAAPDPMGHVGGPAAPLTPDDGGLGPDLPGGGDDAGYRDLPGSFPRPDLPGPSLSVIGQLRFDRWPDPPPGYLAAMAAYLALAGEAGVSNDRLRTIMSSSADTDLSKATLGTYGTNLRRHLPPGVTLARDDGRFRLQGLATDTTTFHHLTRPDPHTSERERIQRACHALALIDGPVLDGATYDWVNDPAVVTLTAQLTDTAAWVAATVLLTNPALARWACHQALAADPTHHGLNHHTLDAARASGQPGALDDEWRAVQHRYTAADLEPGPDLEEHYQRLRQRPA